MKLLERMAIWSEKLQRTPANEQLHLAVWRILEGGNVANRETAIINLIDFGCDLPKDDGLNEKLFPEVYMAVNFLLNSPVKWKTIIRAVSWGKQWKNPKILAYIQEQVKT
jgi:hypothetical protein